MDLTKIKEAQRRRDDRINNWDTHAAGSGHAESNDRGLLLAAVPDLLAEIERLRALAREGWNEARESAKDSGDGVGVDRATLEARCFGAVEGARAHVREIERLKASALATAKARERLAKHFASPPVRDCWCLGCEKDRATIAGAEATS